LLLSFKNDINFIYFSPTHIITPEEIKQVIYINFLQLHICSLNSLRSKQMCNLQMVRKLRKREETLSKSLNTPAYGGSLFAEESINAVSKTEYDRIRHLVNEVYGKEIACLAKARRRKQQMDNVLSLCSTPNTSMTNDQKIISSSKLLSANNGAPTLINDYFEISEESTLQNAREKTKLIMSDDSTSANLDWRNEYVPTATINVHHPAIVASSKNDKAIASISSDSQRNISADAGLVLSDRDNHVLLSHYGSSKISRQLTSTKECTFVDEEDSRNLTSNTPQKQVKKSLRLPKSPNSTCVADVNVMMNCLRQRQSANKIPGFNSFTDNPSVSVVSKDDNGFNTLYRTDIPVSNTNYLRTQRTASGQTYVTCRSEMNTNSTDSKKRAIKANNILSDGFFSKEIVADNETGKDRTFIQI
jgi:hypothetical protein